MFLFVEVTRQPQVCSQILSGFSPFSRPSYWPGTYRVGKATIIPRSHLVLASPVVGLQVWATTRGFVFCKQKQKHGFWGPNLVVPAIAQLKMMFSGGIHKVSLERWDEVREEVRVSPFLLFCL